MEWVGIKYPRRIYSVYSVFIFACYLSYLHFNLLVHAIFSYNLKSKASLKHANDSKSARSMRYARVFNRRG